MTQNQIRLGELKETIRHNQAVETQTHEANRINEEHYVRADTVSQAQAAEIARHNLESERQQNVQLVINQNALSEQVRHNKQSEAIGYGNIGVGYAQAAASMASAQAAGISAQAALRNAETSALIAPSTIGYNQAHTADTYSHIGVNESQSVLNKNRGVESYENAHLIHSKGAQQDYINQVQLPLQTNQMRANLINSYADTAMKGSKTIDNLSSALNNWSSAQSRAFDTVSGIAKLIK